MPIKIPDNLPAANILEQENVFVMYEDRAYAQDIRPLRILILNLMPTKVVTETQLLRLLSNTPLQVEVDLIYTASYNPRNTSTDHLTKFYQTFEEVRENRYDGMIITGAPVEQMPFEEVAYWQELVEIMDCSKSHVYSTMHICWGAQAGLYHHYGIGKHPLPSKMSGLFHHKVLEPLEPILRGFDDFFLAPHSRHTEVREEDVRRAAGLKILASSDKAGLYMVASTDGRMIFVFGHPEYDRLTLKAEYDRDRGKGLAIDPPAHYFPDNDPSREPKMSWRSHAHLLYSNWLNYSVYQGTPFDLEEIPAWNAETGEGT